MIRFTTLVFCSLMFLAAALPAESRADANQSILAALEIHDGVVNDFADAKFKRLTKIALDNVVGYGCDALEHYGYKDDAERYRKEWRERADAYFAEGIGALDLGDHAPLSQWLADFYKKLRLRFGDLLIGMLGLEDINTLNYAIPVTFQPRGDNRNGETWDRYEYSLHFVPFASIVTYWGSYGGCLYATKGHPGIRRFCRQIASLLRTGMSLWVAPKLSDYVFNTANNRPRRDLDIDRYELRRYYEAEIARYARP